MKLLFGTAGIPLSSKKSSSISGIEQIKNLGLDCMELEFVRGVNMKVPMAKLVGDASKKFKIPLTIHAPYYVNLNSKEKKKVEDSKIRILRSAEIGKHVGAFSVTFHPAYYQGQNPKEVYEKVKAEIKNMRAELDKNKNSILLSPETTGKSSAFGSFEELVQLSSEISGVGICIDFAHLHARSNGKINSRKEFDKLFETIEKKLGKRVLQNLHMHVSGIKYSEKGEQSHLVLKFSDFKYKELMQSMKHAGVGGFLICESPNLEEDALLLKQIYNKI